MAGTDHSAADDRPIALRRKRRASAAACNVEKASPGPLPSSGGLSRAAGPSSSTTTTTVPAPRTPARHKRVRFSFPPDGASSASTGLTQHIARTRLLDNDRVDLDVLDGTCSARLLSQPSRRLRRTVSAGPVELRRVSPQNIEIQFKPIRQILSDRTKRRITRNRLSETMNEIDAERKSHADVCRELVLVKRELEELSAGTGSGDFAVSSASEEDKVRELQAEIRSLKQQLDGRQSENALASPVPSAQDQVDLIGFGNDQIDDNCSVVEHDFDGETRPATPATPISLYPSAPESKVSTPTTASEVQTKLSGPEIAQIQHHLHAQAERLRDARLNLERLIPGETALPLASPTKATSQLSNASLSLEFPLADADPLISALFDHLGNMSDRAARTAQALTAAEDQRANLRGNFCAALQQLDELRTAHASLIADSQRRRPRTPASSPAPSEGESTAADKENASPVDTTEYERLIADAQRRIEKLEEDAESYEKDRAALIAALNKYRSEVKDLEGLINSMEAGHKTQVHDLRCEHALAMGKLANEHAQLFDDYEAQVEAETQGRREAERQIDVIVERWATQRDQSERDAGRLNVQIANLTEQLNEGERAIADLQKHLTGVRERVELFVSSVGGQLAWAEIETGRAEPELPSNESQRARSMPPATLSWGLLTPCVEGGRFRDVVHGQPSPDLSSDPVAAGYSVEGKVEIARGKKRAQRPRYDNGIGVVAEELDEE